MLEFDVALKENMSKIPVVSIIGRPNVGKSTLFNRLVGKRVAIVDKTAGTTRDRVVELMQWNEKPFILIDTAGFITDFFGFEEAEIEKKAQKQIEQSIADSDLILLVVDIKSGITPSDKAIANLARKANKKIIVVCNKADSPEWEKKADEFAALGFADVVFTSSASGRRTGLLLDRITHELPKAEQEKNKLKKVAIIGRPNVGKSTLFNAICNEEIAIVSGVAGTTRDSIKIKLSFGDNRNETFEIIDTAGLRRRGRIKPGIEKYSVFRSIESIIASNLVLLVIDAAEGITRSDAHLCKLALDNRKNVLIVLNKIDLLKHGTKDEIKNLYRFAFLGKQKMVAVSAANKSNIQLLINEIFQELKSSN